ncbi:2',3'-cyclic-nucleotide 2'-phosphodiesterase (5'-nucleotidase family) [Oikeobacillus pervagus]|uniref:2',3'-cyclic-nucleotide 2'-phosphodiesterase (5'-nucleotidase family) n=1 Tax=Oikeobacillus pervagus TaxID=1325931 RepID=A0AAJ1T1W3_9BACI|nr:bifunctional UDP-sugar hydrolase/5'-nucleotidase [Oikeobacillus pervagus]MDQ0215156.1 2',3'-cyclic-nucleotide 2'-phosphodiesterase (5'-nucleotidase family) [Oikeobacillus pervagus]
MENRGEKLLETVHIYHINDFHSHFENWPRMDEFMKKRKSWHQSEGEEVFLFDLGDHIDRSHPYTEATLGKGNVQLLNEAGFDAVTIGNNEGITLPKEALQHLYDEADFEVVLSNLYDQHGQRPGWANPYKIYELKNGMTLAVTAATAYFSKSYELLGWKIKDPIEELKTQVKSLATQADIIIVLSHLGLYDDEKIATEIPEVDIIIGAHTHHILHEGKEVGQSLLCAAGKFGYFVGHIMLEVDSTQKQICQKKAILYDTNELPETSNEEGRIQQFYEKGKDLLKEPVVFLDHSIESDWFQPSPLPQILCEALTEWCEADCGMLNAGLVLDYLPSGTVTKYDIHRILPHPINPCIIEISGAELKEVIKQTLDPKWTQFQLQGLGFRGRVMGKFIYDRIEIKDENEEILVDGELVDLGKTYKLATTDMFTFGRFFPALYRAKKKQYFMPEFLRDLLEWKLLKMHG